MDTVEFNYRKPERKNSFREIFIKNKTHGALRVMLDIASRNGMWTSLNGLSFTSEDIKAEMKLRDCQLPLS